MTEIKKSGILIIPTKYGKYSHLKHCVILSTQVEGVPESTEDFVVRGFAEIYDLNVCIEKHNYTVFTEDAFLKAIATEPSLREVCPYFKNNVYFKTHHHLFPKIKGLINTEQIVHELFGIIDVIKKDETSINVDNPEWTGQAEFLNDLHSYQGGLIKVVYNNTRGNQAIMRYGILMKVVLDPVFPEEYIKYFTSYIEVVDFMQDQCFKVPLSSISEILPADPTDYLTLAAMLYKICDPNLTSEEIDKEQRQRYAKNMEIVEKATGVISIEKTIKLPAAISESTVTYTEHFIPNVTPFCTLSL